tara:strand:- start:1976 stop:2200 length:225 start_codon:yes stop_codon:yes gene_type:complete
MEKQMDRCQTCKSTRLAFVSGKCNDLCDFVSGDFSRCDYVPTEAGIGGDDYITFIYCLDCGQIQGQWPLESITQ